MELFLAEEGGIHKRRGTVGQQVANERSHRFFVAPFSREALWATFAHAVSSHEGDPFSWWHQSILNWKKMDMTCIVWAFLVQWHLVTLFGHLDHLIIVLFRDLLRPCGRIDICALSSKWRNFKLFWLGSHVHGASTFWSQKGLWTQVNKRTQTFFGQGHPVS